MTRAVAGINSIQFDRDTIAVLKGRCVSFDIRKSRVLIGRATQKHGIDVNLSYEGPTASISRRQCLLKIESSGRSFLYTIGNASVYVDRRLVRKNSHTELHHNSMIEIGPIRLLFAKNEEAFRPAPTNSTIPSAPTSSNSSLKQTADSPIGSVIESSLGSAGLPDTGLADLKPFV